MKSALRALGWVVAELVPWQAVRVVFDRDFQARMDQAAYAHDCAMGLNEFEAENDGLDGGELPDHPGPRADGDEPTRPSYESLVEAFWAARSIEVEEQALDDIARYYPDSPFTSAHRVDGASPEGAAPHAPSGPPNEEDLKLLARNAAGGISSWLDGSPCRDTRYWTSLYGQLMAFAVSTQK